MSQSVNNKDTQRYQNPKNKPRGLSKKKLSLLSPAADTQKRFKNIQMLQTKMEELKQEPMQDLMQHQQQILNSTDTLQSIQKLKKRGPQPLKLENEQFILQDNYLRGSSQTGKHGRTSPLEMQAEVEINRAFQLNKDSTTSHISEQQLREKLEFFNKRLKDSRAELSLSQTQLNRQSQTQQNQRTLLSNNQSQSKYDINQYSSNNLQKLIRESKGHNNGQQYFKNSRHSNPPQKYDQNGRKSKSKIQSNQIQDTGELIENHYQKLQQSYNEIFQSQSDFRNSMKNQQILSDRLRSREAAQQESTLPEIRSKKRVPNTMSNENTQSESTNQQHANGQNNNNFQNNINNSIILLQAPPIGFMSPQAQVSNGFFQQPNPQIPTQRNDSRGRIDPMRRSQGRGYFPRDNEDFNSPQQFRTRKSMSPGLQNQGQRLTNQRDTGRRRSVANLSGNSNNMRSMSAGDKLSSNDPESIERQNNQMLMQILYNNLKKTQGRSKSKKSKHMKYAPSSSYDLGKKYTVSRTTSKSSQRGLNLMPNSHQTPIERRVKEEVKSEFDGSHKSKEKITNFSSYVKNKLIQSDVKSQSHKSRSPEDQKITKQDPPAQWVSQEHDMRGFQQVDQGQALKGAQNKPLKEEKGQQSPQDQSIQEASHKIESLLKENQIFDDVNCEQITSTMMQLLAEEKILEPQNLKAPKKVKQNKAKQAAIHQLEDSSRSPKGTPEKTQKKNTGRSLSKSHDIARNENLKSKVEDSQKEIMRKQKEESLKKAMDNQLRMAKEEQARKAKLEKQRAKEDLLRKQRLEQLKQQRDEQLKRANEQALMRQKLQQVKKQKLKMPEQPKQSSLINLQKQEKLINSAAKETTLPKNLGEKRKSATSAKSLRPTESEQKNSSHKSETNTAQFPVQSESQGKLANNSSGLQTIIMSKSQSLMGEIKMVPPEISNFANIMEESRNANNSSFQTNSYHVAGEFQYVGVKKKIEFRDEKIGSIQVVSDDEEINLEIQHTPEFMLIDGTPVAQSTPSSIKKVEMEERLVETPQPQVSQKPDQAPVQTKQPTPPPMIPTVLNVIQEEVSSESDIKKAKAPKRETPPPKPEKEVKRKSPSPTPVREASRKTPSPQPQKEVRGRSMLGSKSPQVKKASKNDKFAQFLMSQIEQAVIGEETLESQPKTEMIEMSQISFNNQPLKLEMSNQPQFLPKDVLGKKYKIQMPNLINKSPDSRSKTQVSKQLKINPEPSHSQVNFDMQQNKRLCFQHPNAPQRHLVEDLASFTQINDENEIYSLLKGKMDQFYKESVKSYHLVLRKIQTEKKLQSMSLGKMKISGGSMTQQPDKGQIEIESIKAKLRQECKKINGNMKLFKIDAEQYIQKFQEEINQAESGDTQSQDTVRKSSSKNLIKKQSFVETSNSHLSNDLVFMKENSVHSGRSQSRNLNGSPTPGSRRNSHHSSKDNDGDKMFSESKDFQFLYSDSLRSTTSTNSGMKKKIQTTILPYNHIQVYEDDVSLQLQLKKFLCPLEYEKVSHRSNEEQKDTNRILKKMTNELFNLNRSKQRKKCEKYKQFSDDKKNIDELIKSYYEEQFLIQHPGMDPYKKQEYQVTISDSSSDMESQLLGSTISSFSQFSTQSIDSDARFDFGPLNFKLDQINNRRNSLQDMFQFAQISRDAGIEVSPKGNNYSPSPFKNDDHVGEMFIAEGQDSSISSSRGIINIKSVISLNTNTYQESIQEISDDRQQYQNKTKGFDSCPDYGAYPKVGESERIINSQEIRESNIQPDHIDKPFFFNEQSLVTPKYEKVQLFQLNQTLDQYDIKSVNFFLNKINEIWMSKAKKNINMLKKNVTQAEFSKVSSKYRKMVRKLQKQKYQHTSNLEMFLRFKLLHQINDMIFATQDYQQWLVRRLNGYDSKAIKEKSLILDKWNKQNFWGGNQKLLKKFLQKHHYDSATSLSISSDCDGEEYNNMDCIQMMHEGLNPNLLLKNVIKDKNMQYEIFMILSQTKLQKIKNKLINDSKHPIQERMEMIDQRFKWVQKQASIQYMKARGLEKCPDEIVDLLHKSEFSSEFSSEDSVEQTAKYFFVEDHLLQSTKRQYEIDRSQRRSVSMSQDKAKECKGGQRHGYSFGFRYGNTKKNKSVAKNIKIGRIASPIRSLHVCPDTKEDKGHVRLVNGCPLSLAEEINVKNRFGDKLNFSQRSKAQEDISRIQGYYDDVKDHIKYRSSNDKIIIKYKRKQLLRENQIDEDNHTALKQTHKISQMVHSKKNKQAITYDLTASSIKQYTNPFEISKYVKQENINRIMKSLIKPAKKEKPVHIKTQKFFTADQNQADGVEDFLKSPDYKQGNKCDNFVFKCKLQSIGDFADLKCFINELQLTNQYPKDVLQYKHVIEEDSGYPIYMLFEVLHVKRKTTRDIQQDQVKALKMIKDMTNNQECQKISLLVEKMKQKQQNYSVNNVEI